MGTEHFFKKILFSICFSHMAAYFCHHDKNKRFPQFFFHSFIPLSLINKRDNIKLCAPALLPSVSSATAQVKEGEVVLAHAGASGVGTAAVQLVRLFGAVPIVTAGSPEKLKMAENLGAAAGFNYKEESFAQGVRDFTGGESCSCTDSSLCCRANLRLCSVMFYSNLSNNMSELLIIFTDFSSSLQSLLMITT